MKHWFIVTPIYDVTIPILDDGTGPSEPTADVVCVDAETRRKALVKGVKSLREKYPNGWLKEIDTNPFVGLLAIDATCIHGYNTCDEHFQPCDKCIPLDPDP